MLTMRQLHLAAQGRPGVVTTRTEVVRWLFVRVVTISVTAIVDGSPVGFVGEASWPVGSPLVHGFGPRGSRDKLLAMLGG